MNTEQTRALDSAVAAMTFESPASIESLQKAQATLRSLLPEGTAIDVFQVRQHSENVVVIHIILQTGQVLRRVLGTK